MLSKLIRLGIAVIAFAIGISLAWVWLPKASRPAVKDSELKQQLRDDFVVVAIKGGWSSTACMKGCNEEVRIENTDVLLVRSSSDNEWCAGTKLDGRITEDEWGGLLRLVDGNVLKGLPDVIGCPDCADARAAWVEVTFRDGTAKRVTFEDGRPPQQIRRLAEELEGRRVKC